MPGQDSSVRQREIEKLRSTSRPPTPPTPATHTRPLPFPAPGATIATPDTPKTVGAHGVPVRSAGSRRNKGGSAQAQSAAPQWATRFGKVNTNSRPWPNPLPCLPSKRVAVAKLSGDTGGTNSDHGTEWGWTLGRAAGADLIPASSSTFPFPTHTYTHIHPHVCSVAAGTPGDHARQHRAGAVGPGVTGESGKNHRW